MLLSIISSLIFLSLFAYLPGKIITKLTKLPDWIDLQLTLGISLLSLLLFFSRFFLPFNLILIIYLLIVSLLVKKYSLKFKKPIFNLPILLVILIGVVSQSLPYLKTLNLDLINTAIASNHDQAWHASLTYHLTQSFPSQVPGFSGVVLKNYHYFYDLIIAANVALFKTNINVLIQLVYPIIFSTLFGFSIYRVLSYLTDNKTYQLFGILIAFFGNNLSFATSNFFLIDQPLFFLFNHQTVLSIALVLYFLIILRLQLKKPQVSRGVLLGLVLASLIYLKIYAFLVLGLVLAVLSFKNLKKLLIAFLVTGLLVGLIILLTFEPSQPMLIFKPLWLTTAFTDKIIAPFIPQLFARSHRFFYRPLVIGLILLSNYHLRLLGLLIKKRSLLTNLILLTTISSLVLLFFTFQTQSPYNIIQFAPYATIGLGLLLVAFVKKLKAKTAIFLLVITLLLSLPSSIKTLVSYAKSSPKLPLLKQELVSVVQKLENLPPGLTLSLVDRDYHVIPDPKRPLNFIGNNLITSIGQKPAYFADQKQLEVMNVDYQLRLDKINQLKQNFCHDKTLLKQEKIQYLILADDLFHCAGDNQITFIKIHQTNHFGLFQLSY